MPVNIHGKQYRTVAERIELFHEQHKEDIKSITTEIIINDGNTVLMKTTIKVADNIYEGYAQETYNQGHINKTSAIENCETSAIGRALASAGFVGSEFASANEVENAIKQQKNGVSVIPKKTTKPFNSEKPLNWSEDTRESKVGFGKYSQMKWKEIPKAYLDFIVSKMDNQEIKAKASAELIYRTAESTKPVKKTVKVDREQEQFEKEHGLFDNAPIEVHTNDTEEEVKNYAINRNQ
jgi:hypothetical protein